MEFSPEDRSAIPYINAALNERSRPVRAASFCGVNRHLSDLKKAVVIYMDMLQTTPQHSESMNSKYLYPQRTKFSEHRSPVD